MNEYEKIRAERNEKIKLVEEILLSHDIEMTVDGCTCCENPYVSFAYKGEIIVPETGHFFIDAKKEPSHEAKTLKD